MRLRKASATLEADTAEPAADPIAEPARPDRPPRKTRSIETEGEPDDTSATEPVDARPAPIEAASTPERSQPAPEPAPERRGPSNLVLVTAGLALVGLVVLALGGLSWWRASHDDAIAAAKTRDRALIAASNEIATMNTLDYRDVDGGLKSWLAVTTGTLHDQLTQAGSQDTQLLAGQKKITTAKVVQAALTDLDASGGTATAIASVEITVRGTSGEPTLKRNRFSANLVLTKGRWLLESLTQVPVDAS